ncbi:MAG TPA: ribosome-associated translation inhibitor RaiA [Phycisphaerales bacterium]|nr:ribosome-associated translation inhibitor RaiA [Phycisphaerales bacterium]
MLRRTVLLFTITAKHIEIGQAVRSYAEKKTAKLPRYYDRINRVEVILDGDKNGNVSIEIIARAEHNKVFVVKETQENPYKCIDVAVPKLERQLRKIKGKEHEDKRPEIA